MPVNPKLMGEEFPGICWHCGMVAAPGSRCERFSGLIHNGEPPYRMTWRDNAAELAVIAAFVAGGSAIGWLILSFVLDAIG